MAVNSSNKGKSYELHIAKKLSAWAGFKLIRTPMSGAWQGTAGDIKPRGFEYFPFTVECKKNEGWTFEQIMAGKGPFFDWVEQAEREAAQDTGLTGQIRIPIVIFSRNYADDFIAFPYFSSLPYNYAFRQFAIVDVGGDTYFVSTLEQFLESFTYDDFRLVITNVYWLDSTPREVPMYTDDPDI